MNVPRTPEYVKGVIHLRGKLIPVIEMKQDIDMVTREVYERPCIFLIKIETQLKTIQVGIAFNSVPEFSIDIFNCLVKGCHYDKNFNH